MAEAGLDPDREDPQPPLVLRLSTRLRVRLALLLEALSACPKEAPMRDFSVHQYGTDTSGRPIFMTAYMAQWWEGVVAELGFRPTIVQGAFMSRVPSGGAAASAGYHDLAGCIDVRTWNLTPDQLDRLIRVCRERGAAAWRRDETAAHGGMDSHCHITLGSDQPLSAGALASWRSYLDGRNGLVNNAPDYEWRPKPLVTDPPEDADMPLNDADKQWIKDTIRAEARAAVDDVLNVDMNAQGPKGDQRFRGISLREAVKRIFVATGAKGDQ